MDHEITQKLWDSYPKEDKADFFKAYIYMKYLHHLLHHANTLAGFPVGEPLEKVDPSIEEWIQIEMNYINEGFASRETNVYHGKIVKLADAKKLLTVKEDLHLTPSEKIIPFKIAKNIILTDPASIAVGTCPCRLASPNPCLPPPMEACLFIGDPHASFIAAQNPRFHKISQDEAVNILEDCHKRGFVHVAYFKEDMGKRFFAICNCCKCCCSAVKMQNLLGESWVGTAPSGYVAEVDDDCTGCGICTENTCHFNAISMNEESPRAIIDPKKCMGCGVCEDVCPAGAISLRREPSKTEPLDLEELRRQVS